MEFANVKWTYLSSKSPICFCHAVIKQRMADALNSCGVLLKLGHFFDVAFDL